MQMIFQDPYASLNPRMTVADIVGEPLLVHELRAPQRARRARARAAAARRPQPQHPEPLPARVLRRPAPAHRHRPRPRPEAQLHHLRRARLRARRRIQAQIINLLQDLQGHFGLTYLFIAHDLSVVRHISDRVAVMYLGRIVELAAGTRSSPAHAPLHPGPALRRPHPRPHQRRPTAHPPRRSADPANPPPGCHFHPRCPAARTGLCDVEDPPSPRYAPAIGRPATW